MDGRRLRRDGVTGVLLFYAIPVRSYQNVFFRLKMIALVLAGLNAWVFHIGVHRGAPNGISTRAAAARARRRRGLARPVGGDHRRRGRMIAYNWFDCDRQPQPIHQRATGCDAGKIPK